MNTAAIPVQPESAVDLAAKDSLYYRGVLHELIAMSTDLARMAHQEAMTAAAPAEAAAAFERMARCVRRSVVLARKVAEPARAGQAHHRVAARKQIIRDVEDAIQRMSPRGDAERLQGELRERLDAPDLEDDIYARPVADIIEEICRDLGLEGIKGLNTWKRRTPADVAALRDWAAQRPVTKLNPVMTMRLHGHDGSGPPPGRAPP